MRSAGKSSTRRREKDQDRTSQEANPMTGETIVNARQFVLLLAPVQWLLLGCGSCVYNLGNKKLKLALLFLLNIGCVAVPGTQFHFYQTGAVPRNYIVAVLLGEASVSYGLVLLWLKRLKKNGLRNKGA
jgi:hypothetical protein